MKQPKNSASWPPRLAVGLLLVSVCWPLSWALPGLRTHVLFFPLWLGYILIVDAWVERRAGASLWSRSRAGFWALFIASAPAWWLFELFNWRLGNWIYLGREEFSDVEFFLWSTLNFSIVIPAVFETAALVRTFAWVDRRSGGPRVTVSPAALATYAAAGGLMLGALLAWPRPLFPLTWLALVFLLDPIARATGRTSLLDHLRLGDWRPALSLALGALICGFFWELWNIYSYPKWIYQIPYFDFAHVFEMPLLGYLGYLPFGLELYPLTHLLTPRSLAPDLGFRST